jgi:phage shock protein B
MLPFDLESTLVPVIIVGIIFGVLPYLVFNFILQLKKTRSLTAEDETVFEDLIRTADRLENRVQTVERILDAENPNWRKGPYS